MAVVYRATNKINGKSYIGVSRRTVAYRRAAHYNDARHGLVGSARFVEAIRKYGEGAFVWDILGEYETIEEALAAEIRFIAELRPKYNISAGGEGAPGAKWSPERRVAASLARKGKKQPPGHGAKIAAAWTPEMRARQAEITRRRNLSGVLVPKLKAAAVRTGLCRPIVCLDDGLVYPSGTDAAIHYGLSRPKILDCCKGIRLHTHGKHFAYHYGPMTNDHRLRAVASLVRLAKAGTMPEVV
ncbi:MAG: GIY-YIG nuclease family protein [Patescibacteria group bacterium]|nr:GIY-YIG nuclease family protein [Patescibacteria group bacterium]